MSAENTSVPNSAAVYYKDRYWNDHPRCLEQIKRLFAADLSQNPRWFVEHFRESFLKNKPVERALFLNCGNGWVEREFIDSGLVLHATAFDYSQALLDEAEKLRDGRTIEYFRADCNTIWFPENSFDLVVNIAAMHHVQWIDRMNQVIARALTPEGFFLNWDYVGPHRNQYGQRAWSQMQRINEMLPLGFQAEPFTYPDVEAMIAADPTEAIHSELSLTCFERYFTYLERKDVYGGIAYQLMHNNHELHTRGVSTAERSVQFLLACDELAGATGAAPLLFSYYVGSPKKKVFESPQRELVERYVKEEIAREAEAALHGGRYYMETESER